MSFDDRHTDRVERRAVSGDEDESARDADFEAALAERYRRLSLLTLDLAEEAGEAAVNFSLVDMKGVRPAFFDRRLAAMTRAIWAHRVIERLRGAPAPAAKVAYREDVAKAATLRSGATAAQGCDAGGAEPMQPFPDDGWTPRPRAKARFFKIQPPSRAGMASMLASGENAADETRSPEPRPDERWTPSIEFNRPSRGESGVVNGEVERGNGVRIDMLDAGEAALIDSINDDGRGLGAVIDALAEDDLMADDFGASKQTPTRHGPAAKAASLRASAPSRAGMASMPASGENAADETRSREQSPDERSTPRSRAKARFFKIRPPLRPSRGESEILEAGVAERDVGVRGDTSDNNKPVFGPVFGRRRFFSPP